MVNKRLLEQNKVRVVRGQSQKRSCVALASCGEALAGVDIRIVDPETRRLAAANEVGEIWLAGHSKALGYWNRPDLSADLFEARIADEAGSIGYLRTGDMGFMHERDLYVCGRLRDMIFLRGANVHPADIEAVVEGALALNTQVKWPPFVPARTVMTKVSPCLSRHRRKNGYPALPELHRKLRGTLHVPIVTMAYVPKRSLVRTSSAKISRHRCRDLWDRGALRVIDCFHVEALSAANDDIVNYMERLAESLGANANATLEELGLDSFELVTLSLEIERFLARTVGRGAIPDDALDARALQSMTVRELKRRAEDIEAGRTNMHAVRLSYRETAQYVAERDGSQMRADAVLAPTYNRGAPARRRRSVAQSASCLQVQQDFWAHICSKRCCA